MTPITISELCHHGGRFIDRVLAGESLLVTRHGRPVAELRAIRQVRYSAEELLERWRRVPAVDRAGLLADIDAVVHGRL